MRPARELSPRTTPIAPAVGQPGSRLPLTAMDRALIAQTLPGRPMSTHHALEVRAHLPPELLAEAAAHLARTCPTLRSVIVDPLSREVSPFSSERLAAALQLEETGSVAGSDWLARPFELALDWPFRLRQASLPDGRQELTFTLHHSVTDGRGALTLFDWLLRTALALRAGAPPPPSPLSPRASRPLLLDVFRHAEANVARLVTQTGRNALRFLQHRASLLDNPADSVDGFAVHVEDLATTEWHALKLAARRLRCTRNDLLWCAALRAADRSRQTRHLSEETFRLVGGVDLRGFFGAEDALHNWVGTMEADFTPAEVRTAELEALVHARLAQARTPEAALVTPVLLELLHGGLGRKRLGRIFAAADRGARPFLYSLLVSHIRAADGLCWHPELRPVRLWCASTLPRKPGLGITVTSNADHATLAACWPTPLARAETVRALLREVKAEVSRYAQRAADGDALISV